MARLIEILLANGCIITGITFLVIKILDWYNPFMDFAGQSALIQYLLCGFTVLSGIFELFKVRIKKQIVKK